MIVEQYLYTPKGEWVPSSPGDLGNDAQLVLVFAGTEIIRQGDLCKTLRLAYPSARILGCSTAGEIRGTQVSDDSASVTAIRFEHTTVKGARIAIHDIGDSFESGSQLSGMLPHAGLRHVLVLSNGLKVNGSALVRGLTSGLPANVAVTGGLAGDGGRFQDTPIVWDAVSEQDAVVVLGLYSERLHVGYGSMGGWDPFGPERLITRSEGNVLYEFDGKSALSLYKRYLGEHAEGLPATGLLFPLTLRSPEGERGVVRTILGVDEDKQSMTFAGDIPEGSYARLMKANVDRLIDGAEGAARAAREMMGPAQPELALLISCVGRKMVLRQRVEEELEGVQDILGSQTKMTGFYSYGEIAPHAALSRCELHNQTMTVTTFSEG